MEQIATKLAPAGAAGAEPIGSATIDRRVEARRVAKAAFIGTAIEWYDFFIYATAAALVFGDQFFPTLSETAQTLASFATISVAFVARPVGGMVFAHFGDRVGRKRTLIASLLIMGTATALIGVLPTYDDIGVAAPVLLVTLRFIQGFAVGGEWGGAVLMATEHAPPGERARLSSWPQLGVPAGLALSTALALAVAVVIPDSAFTAWGWRIPFVLSVVLIAVGLVLRLRITESPVFEASRREPAQDDALPAVEVVRSMPRRLVLASVCVVAVSATFYVAFVFLLAHATGTEDIAKSAALAGVLVAAGVYSVGLRASARWADRRGRRSALLGGMALTAVTVAPLLALTSTGSPWLFAVGLSAFAFGVGATYAPIGVYLAELFPTRVRYSGITAAYQLGGILGGGVAPFIAAGLYSAVGLPGIAGYVLAMLACSTAAVVSLGETKGVRL